MMKFPNNHKKSIAAFLILFALLALAGGLLIPQKPAKALNATLVQQIIQFIMDKVSWAKDYAKQLEQELSLSTVEEIQEWFKDDTLERRDQRESWNEERKERLDELVNDVLDNMKDMGDGEPAFVDPWADYLQEKTQKYFDDFVENELEQAEICETFESEIKESIKAGNEPSYTEQAASKISNPQALLDGGSQTFWDDYLAMIVPSGNPFGSYMIASDAKLEQEC